MNEDNIFGESDFDRMTDKLGTRIANRLWRYGVRTIDDLKHYISQHRFSKTECFVCLYWKGIGPESYQKIIDFLKEEPT